MLESVEMLRRRVLDVGADGNGLKTDFDVFGLAKVHADLMDTILASCLLRSSQSNVSDALREVLRTILSLGRLVLRTSMREVPEILAAAELEELHNAFESHTAKFVSPMG
jgi:hypothetical protein